MSLPLSLVMSLFTHLYYHISLSIPYQSQDAKGALHSTLLYLFGLLLMLLLKSLAEHFDVAFTWRPSKTLKS